MIRETEEAETYAAFTMVKVKALCIATSPVMPDGDDTFTFDTFVVEDLAKGIGLLAVVVALWFGGFRGA